jgi:hypothetical protein
MQLLPDDLRAQLPPLCSQEKNKDPTVHIRYFTPDSNWTWLVTEGEQVEDEFQFFGFVKGFAGEWGYFRLRDLESTHGPNGLPIERDLFFEPAPFSVVKHRERLDVAEDEEEDCGCFTN